jgi:hypothetical protein
MDRRCAEAVSGIARRTRQLCRNQQFRPLLSALQNQLLRRRECGVHPQSHGSRSRRRVDRYRRLRDSSASAADQHLERFRPSRASGRINYFRKRPRIECLELHPSSTRRGSSSTSPASDPHLLLRQPRLTHRVDRRLQERRAAHQVSDAELGIEAANLCTDFLLAQ